MIVPPYSEYLRAVRLVAADAAVRAGLDCDETEDFRLAVDELSHTMMSATDHTLRLSFATTQTGVRAHGSAPARSATPPTLDELSATLVTALADGYDLELLGTELRFLVQRNRMGAPAG